ncbi:MAG: dihydroorotase [Clostridia bacterium]|nr:dihydroorotase [Clostridia bacterium]
MKKLIEMQNMNTAHLAAAASFPLSSFFSFSDFSLEDSSRYTVFPGFCDVHVHFREPGFSYKETIKGGSLAAAYGGYTAVCTMPNLAPVPDNLEHLAPQLALIDEGACIHVYPYGAITQRQCGEALADLEAMSPFVIAFSDDGRGVASEALMREAMTRAKALGKMIVAHCEDMSYIKKGGCIHDGDYAAAHGHIGISSESEWKQVERDLRLVEEIGCRYHVCHISTKETVALIRDAKARGLDVTCETGPHYLVLDDSSLQEEGRFKMNPPLRAAADREALVEGLIDGTIDMIATDHAPHAAEEKAKGLSGSAFGIVGLETAFPLLYTKLVRTGVLSLERLIDAMAIAPRRRFGIPFGNDFTVFELDAQFTVDPDSFHGAGRATPFAGEVLYGKHRLTVCDGKIVAEQ